MRGRRPVLFAAALALAASAAAADIARPRLTAEQVRDRATITADPLDFVSEITTRKAHRSGRAAAGTIRSDAYLAATIDRRSGAVRYQLRKEIRYAGPRRDFRAAHFIDEGELRRVPLALARHGADQCPNSDFNHDCLLTKSLAFDLSEPLLRRIASSGQPWAFKLKEAGGKDVRGTLAPAEAEGLLRAVADYRAQSGRPESASAAMTAPDPS